MRLGKMVLTMGSIFNLDIFAETMADNAGAARVGYCLFLGEFPERAEDVLNVSQAFIAVGYAA
ncbi:MAG: hypothetical protein L0312_02380 [Acidobacteria bacterium]|nr:hypothetical protein [Acidobacteriota bacterium]